MDARTRKGLNRLNSSKTCSFSMILGFRAVSFRNKNIKESLKKPIRCGHTVLHRLFVDLGSILAPFWEPNRSKNRSKKPSKKRTSKKRRPRGSRTPKGIDGGDRHHRFWTSGRSPPYCWVNPSSLGLVIAFGLMTTPPEPSFFDLMLVSFPDHFDIIFESCLCPA